MSERLGGNSIPWGSIAVVAAFVSSTFLVQQAFQPLRPADKERSAPQQGAVLEVEARLWEDPFAAARRYETERFDRCDKKANSTVLRAAAKVLTVPGQNAALASNPASAAASDVQPAECDDLLIRERRKPLRLIEALDRNRNHDLTESLVVVVTLPGNAFVGAEESRRRTRYAVLAGLQAQGLAPDDAEHFGLLQFDLQSGDRLRPMRVPYEMFSLQPTLRGDAVGDRKSHSYEQAALLWVDETSLPQPRLDALASLLGALMKAPEGWNKKRPTEGDAKPNLPALVLIGPSSSDGLRASLVDLDRAANRCPPAPLSEIDARSGDNAYVAARARCEEELKPEVVAGYKHMANARLFNAVATASDRAMPELHDQKLETYLNERLARIGGAPASKKIDYMRTMAADDRVLRSMVKELELRLPINATRRVVLLAERDSLYAKALVSELRFRLTDPKSVQHNPWLRLETHYFYRGLDGATTFEGVAERSSSGKDKDGVAVLEWPESRDQLDYLRRLAISLKASESGRGAEVPLAGRELGNGTESGAIGAIGILASDVHDKLLVLQALHDSFPDKVFFTTDLDARLVHSRTLAYTRNLVVTSSLPLVFADPRLQAGAPPFRDAYQTAVFLAARQAACRSGKYCDDLKVAIENVRDAPSIYEIGRQQAVPISGYDHSQRVLNQHAAHAGIALPLWLLLAGALLVWPGTPALRRVRKWLLRMPPATGESPAVPRLATVLLAVVHMSVLAFALGNAVEFAAPGRLGLGGILLLTATVTGVALVLLLGRGAMRLPAAGTAAAMPNWLAPAVGVLLMAAAAAWIAWPAQSAAPCTECEPAAWLDGVSAWPSHLVHLLALVTLVCILDVQWNRLRDRFEQDTQWLGLAPAELASADLLKRSWWRHRSLMAWSTPGGKAHHDAVDFEGLWRENAYRAEPVARMLRTAVFYVVTLGLMIGFFYALSDGQVPEVPVRGHDHRWIVRSTLYALLMLLPLLMVAVADATMLTQRFIYLLDGGRSFYPEVILQRFAAALGVANLEKWLCRFAAEPWQRGDAQAQKLHTLLDNWIDVRLVGRRTAAVAPLIVGPLVIVALLAVARSRLFDNWAITLPVALGICAYLVWLVVLAVLLKLAAERARDKALLRMQADLLWLQGSDLEPLVEPFKALIDEVRDIREGAFAPLFEQPLFRGLMVPLGGIGSTQLFDYLLLAR
jgi:hypothetical protein